MPGGTPSACVQPGWPAAWLARAVTGLTEQPATGSMPRLLAHTTVVGWAGGWVVVNGWWPVGEVLRVEGGRCCGVVMGGSGQEQLSKPREGRASTATRGQTLGR